MPRAICDRLIGRLSDYERGIWTPKPFERVRIVPAGTPATFIGTVGHVRVFNGDDLGRLVQTADAVRPVVIVDEPLVATAPDWMRVCAWNELEPAPPAGCQCPVCCAGRAHRCICPVDGCVGGCTSDERRSR